ncbi:AEC family transporter [Frigidibacter sp. MR17.24]|uniref:AEC family transporter n=1 Tax=Frigidibacter sp. MR17.24 TaxID=3127345 RepID=UPI003012A7F0
MYEIFATVAPDFLLILLGGAIRNRLAAEAWRGLDRLNFEVLFPALLFVAASSRPIAVSELAGLGLLVWGLLFAGFGLGWLARPLGPERFIDFAGSWQVAWRFNTALGFVCIATLPPQSQALMPVAIGMGVPLANVLAVSALSRGGGLGIAATAKRVALNPFLLATVAGMTVGLTGLPVPSLLMDGAGRAAAASIPIALISVGAMLDWGALLRPTPFTLAIGAIKLLVLPALALGAVLALGLDPARGAVLILFAALPTAAASHVLASVFGADPRWPSTMVAQTTIWSVLTLPPWIAVARGLF